MTPEAPTLKNINQPYYCTIVIRTHCIHSFHYNFVWIREWKGREGRGWLLVEGKGGGGPVIESEEVVTQCLLGTRLGWVALAGGWCTVCHGTSGLGQGDTHSLTFITDMTTSESEPEIHQCDYISCKTYSLPVLRSGILDVADPFHF